MLNWRDMKFISFFVATMMASIPLTTSASVFVPQYDSINDLITQNEGKGSVSCESVLESAERTRAGVGFLTQNHTLFVKKEAAAQLLELYNILFALGVLLDAPEEAAKQILPKGMTLEMAFNKTLAFVKQSKLKNLSKNPHAYQSLGAELLMVLGRVEELQQGLHYRKLGNLMDSSSSMFLELSDIYEEQFGHAASMASFHSMAKGLLSQMGNSDFARELGELMGQMPASFQGAAFVIPHMIMIRAARLMSYSRFGDLVAITRELSLYSQLVSNLNESDRASYSSVTTRVMIAYAESYIIISKYSKRPLSSLPANMRDLIGRSIEAASQTFLQHWYEFGFIVTPGIRDIFLPPIAAKVRAGFEPAENPVKEIYERLYVILSTPAQGSGPSSLN